jgi:hypothetical protein
VSLEIRSTDDPEVFDLYEGDDRIGEIRRGFFSEEDIAEGEPPYWEATVWSLMGTAKEGHADDEDIDSVKRQVAELYEEFVTERRRLHQPGSGPRVRTISTPTGGQKRR